MADDRRPFRSLVSRLQNTRTDERRHGCSACFIGYRVSSLLYDFNYHEALMTSDDELMTDKRASSPFHSSCERPAAQEVNRADMLRSEWKLATPEEKNEFFNHIIISLFA